MGKANKILDGRQTVTTGGTAVQLTTDDVPCEAVMVTALEGNTDKVVVGTSTVVAALASRRGKPLDADESVTVPCKNANQIYLDAVVDGEGVSFLAVAYDANS